MQTCKAKKIETKNILITYQKELVVGVIIHFNIVYQLLCQKGKKDPRTVFHFPALSEKVTSIDRIGFLYTLYA